MAHAGSLSAAAATGELGQIHGHMASGGCIDERDTHLNTPLHHACLAGNRSAVELLLSYGADVNAENKQGKSCLQFAGHSGDNVIISRLIEAGADVTHQSHDGKTALHSAVANDFPDAARLLLEAGAEVDSPENEGNTPLHKAAQKDFPLCVELLRSYNANQFVRNDAGHTPIDIARDNGFHEVLDALINTPLPRSHWSTYDYEESLPRESDSATDTTTLNLSSLVTQVQRPKSNTMPVSPASHSSPAPSTHTMPAPLANVSTTTSPTTGTGTTMANNGAGRPRGPGTAAAAMSMAKAADVGLKSANSTAVHDVKATLASSPSNAARASVRLPERPSLLDELFSNPGVPHRTLYDFKGSRPDELTFKANEQVLVLKRFDDGWLLGEHEGLVGMFPAKYALLETMPRHSNAKEARKPSSPKLPVVPQLPTNTITDVKPAPRSSPLAMQTTTAASSAGLASSPPLSPSPMMSPNIATAANNARTLAATAATSSSEFARSDANVISAHAAVTKSEKRVHRMIDEIEIIRTRDVQPFLDSVPTMAAAAGRAYDTALRSVQLLAQTAQGINASSELDGGKSFVQSAQLSDTMLQATSAWVQSRQALADEGKTLRETISLPLTTQNVEMTRTLKLVRRALNVYGRLLVGMVESLENAHSSGEAAALQSARDGLARTVSFVVQRHGSLLDSLRWRQQTLLKTLFNGWTAWAEFERELHSLSEKRAQQLQAALESVDLPDSDLPDSDWESDVKL